MTQTITVRKIDFATMTETNETVEIPSTEEIVGNSALLSALAKRKKKKGIDHMIEEGKRWDQTND